MITYDGNLATKMIFDITFLDGVWSLLLDDLEQLLDAHRIHWLRLIARAKQMVWSIINSDGVCLR